jgi:hypothetical protein
LLRLLKNPLWSDDEGVLFALGGLLSLTQTLQRDKPQICINRGTFQSAVDIKDRLLNIFAGEGNA